MEIPKINNTYNCFDDGKIRESRLYTVTVKKLIPFEDAETSLLLEWNTEVCNCNWLYKRNTDFFVVTVNQDNEEEIFVRTINNGWFSIGGFLQGGRLDVDGSLTKILNNI